MGFGILGPPYLYDLAESFFEEFYSSSIFIVWNI